MSMKLVAVILILIVILFVTGVAGAGASASQAAVERGKSSLSALERLFVHGQALAQKDVASATPGSCLDLLSNGQLALQRGATCSYVVRGSSSLRRTLSLRLEAGQELSVAVQHKNGDILASTQKLKLNKTVDLQLFKEGATVALQCSPASTVNCLVRAVTP
jgi:hypothetical protein